jgi:hypothetical protein
MSFVVKKCIIIMRIICAFSHSILIRVKVTYYFQSAKSPLKKWCCVIVGVKCGPKNNDSRFRRMSAYLRAGNLLRSKSSIRLEKPAADKYSGIWDFGIDGNWQHEVVAHR